MGHISVQASHILQTGQQERLDVPHWRFQDVTPYRPFNRPKMCHGLLLRQFQSHNEGTTIDRNVGKFYHSKCCNDQTDLNLMRFRSPAKRCVLNCTGLQHRRTVIVCSRHQQFPCYSSCQVPESSTSSFIHRKEKK